MVTEEPTPFPPPATARAEDAQLNGRPSPWEGLRPAPTQSRQRVRVRGFSQVRVLLPAAGVDRPPRPRQNRVPVACRQGIRRTGESDPHSTCVNTVAPP